MENPIKMDDLGGKPPIFGNIHIFFSQALHQGGKKGRCHGVDLYLSATESFQMVDGLAGVGFP